ncbi:hypothetical protein BCV69DRAFT_19183 [Microstroma glucosiphilum]|uniref:Uncharacterized protein n=1 Tax=Pseudomicrostroma glucosiphilum TaxID=1684307 RepID=A0A316UFH4_9BASI|nr:hypothetical protein BCV69DRAFT_19183 [Pseudomicrostroma glucosiphilum]PWN24067.1 hypothetical protein BCV69DRAFT_19183 [Pseudomicrostroma glucosiphilum]
MAHRDSIPPPLVRNGSSPMLGTSNAARSMPKNGSTSRSRGLTVGPSAMPSSPLASSSFSASSASSGSSTPPMASRRMSVSTQSPLLRAQAAQASPVKSRLRGLSISSHSPRSGRGLMVLEGPEEPLEDFSDFSFGEAPLSNTKPSMAATKPSTQSSAISWWGQSDLTVPEQSSYSYGGLEEPLGSPEAPVVDPLSPSSLKSFFNLPSPPPTMSSVAPDMAPDSVVVRSPQSITDGELPELMADVDHSVTSLLESDDLPDDVEDLRDLVKDLRAALSSQSVRSTTLSSSLQDLAQRSAAWKHALEVAQDIRVPAMEAQVRQLNEEKARLEARLQTAGPKVQESRRAFSLSEVGPAHDVPLSNLSSQSSTPEPLSVEANGASANTAISPGPKGPRLSQIMQDELPASNLPVPPARRNSLFSLPGSRAFSWSSAPTARSSVVSTSGISPRESVAESNADSTAEISNANISTADAATAAEMALMRSEMQRLRAKLEEATEARKASDDCLKALKEFIGEGAPGVRSRASSRGSLTGIKLPPLPTADEEDEEEEIATAKKASTTDASAAVPSSSEAAPESETLVSSLTSVRSSLGSLFARSPSISLGSGQSLLGRASSLTLAASPLGKTASTAADSQDEEQGAGNNEVHEVSPAPVAPVAPKEEESTPTPLTTASSTSTTSATPASAVAPTLNRLGGWFKRPSIWEAPPTLPSLPGTAAEALSETPAQATEASTASQNPDQAQVAVAATSPEVARAVTDVTEAVVEVVAPAPMVPQKPAESRVEPAPVAVAPITAAEVVEIVSPTSPKLVTPPMEVRSPTSVPALPRKNLAARARTRSQVVKPAESSLDAAKEAPLVTVPLDG